MNKFYATGAMKQGIGTVSSTKAKTPGTIRAGTDPMPMKTPSWPGLPGKTQPRDRSAGVPEEKVYAVARGLRGGTDND